jgi:outer membrane receptor protein involved in Fe transport
LFCALSVLLAGNVVARVNADADLQEIVVTASLRRQSLDELAASITFLDAARLQASSVDHLQDVLPFVPNLNWASGTSRPRYFQLRGIGETDQWQGAPNASVGFLIDDMDFSGVGMPASSHDLAQVEVLRGPQGTSHGANALGGLILLRSAEPRSEFDAGLELTAAEFADHAVSAHLGGVVADTRSAPWLGRMSIVRHRSDGFRRNVTLDRDDTNGYDETYWRGKLRGELGPHALLTLSALFADLDNGYDAFALDNSRTTRSDRPGRDAQRSRGVSAVLEGEVGAIWSWRSVTSLTDSDIVYSFDGDWTDSAEYDFFSKLEREHRVVAQDFRLISQQEFCRPCWVIGLYAKRLEESNEQLDRYNGELFRSLTSDYRASKLALYASAAWSVNARLRLEFGLRSERRAANYGDSDGTAFDPRDSMLGGQLNLSLALPATRLLARSNAYVTVARGYKAGGFNIGAAVPDALRGFGPEYLWNLESGWSFAARDDRWRGRVALFSMRRREQQVSTSLQIDPADPLSFLFLTSNRGRGRNHGLEFEGRWQTTPQLNFNAAVGLLRARRDDGRDQEHAPRRHISVGGEYRAANGWFARLDAQRMSAYYYSDSHNQISSAYSLLNARIGWRGEHWSAEFWARNLLDETYARRGFFFGNEPPDFPERLYTQAADPRQVGITLRYNPFVASAP